MNKQLKVIFMLAGALLLAGCVEDEVSSSHYTSSMSSTTTSYGSGHHSQSNQGYSTSQDGSYVSGDYSSDGYSASASPRRKVSNQAVVPAGSSGFQSSSGVSPEAAAPRPPVDGTTTSSSTSTSTSSVVPVESAPVSGFSSSN